MKKFLRVLLIVLLLVAVAAFYNYPKLNIVSGFAVKNAASAHFIANRSFGAISQSENNMPLINMADVTVSESQVYATVFGLMARKSICRDGLGCVLVSEDYEGAKTSLIPQRTKGHNSLPFPYGNIGTKDTVFANVDYKKLKAAVTRAFEPYEPQKTRTLLVAYKNHIIAEEYSEGFSPETPVLGWSMTKSVLATLYGILEYQEKLDVQQSAPVKAWEDDERKNITLNNLLRMESGLQWDEDYAAISDVTKMLFLEPDMTASQAKLPNVAAPSEIWNYSSGTTNLLSGILRTQFETYQEYLDFPYSALIDRIGMHSMLIEADMEGNYVGSSYGWASTRDWAKFGLLYLNKGNWNGEQLFDPKWVDYVTKPTADSEGVYGAHFWLNAGGKYPDAPKDLYSANGFQGQRVFIIPSKDLVIVRTGLEQEPIFDANTLLKEVLAAIE